MGLVGAATAMPMLLFCAGAALFQLIVLRLSPRMALFVAVLLTAAALTGTPAWEMFKPWAITSMTTSLVPL